MFQPQPTPYAASFGPYGVGNDIPGFAYQSTPLGGPAGGAGGGTTSILYGPSALYHNSLQNNQHHLPYANSSSASSSAANNSNRHHIKMEPNSTSDLAAQEAAARDYRPEFQGPLVGDKTSSHAITQEYARADPIYVEKTVALPQTYSHYRPIRGDGNCGWRAIGFGYFESLVRSGDLGLIQNERNRLASLNEFISRNGGYSLMLFEDAVNETLELLQEIHASISSGQDATALVFQKFNDDQVEPSIIWHLRLLVSSLMKADANYYESYVGDVNTYCANTIDPSYREIDQMGLTALYQVLLKPAGIMLDIAYLDRSQGSEANTICYRNQEIGQTDDSLGTHVYLLYRPDHYDILYRDGVAHPTIPTQSVDIHVNRAMSFSQSHQFQNTMPAYQQLGTMEFATLSMIPSAFDGPGLSPLSSPPPSASPMSDAYTPSPQASWTQPTYATESLPTIPQHRAPQPQTSVPMPQPQKALNNNPLRFSKWNFPGMMDNDYPTASPVEPTCTTSLFKNSHFNTAHYSNPNFQPEEYKPGYDDDDEPRRGSGSRSGGRKKSAHKGIKNEID